MKTRILISLLLAGVVLTMSCGGDDKPTNPPSDADDIDAYLQNLPAWSEFSPQLAPVGEPEDVVTGPTEATLDTSGDEIYVCRTTPCSITSTPDAIVTMNPNSEILYLGSLIQGSTYLGGLGAMEELPIRQRAPLTISIDLLYPDNTRTVADPTLASVNQAVGELISGAQNAGHQAGSAISYNKKECHSLRQSMLDMGLSASYMGASVSMELQFSQSAEQHAIMATFRQRMFTTSIVLPQTPSELFSDQFTQEILDAQIALGRVGPQNLPVYVSNIVWGRIMIFTMTSTYTASQMQAAIEASYQGIAGGSVDAQYLAILNSEETTINMVTVGGEASHALDAICSGNLDEYFAADAALTSAAPLSYTLRNLADNSVALVSETTNYDRVECSTDIVAYYNDYDLWRNAVLALPGGEVFSQTLSAAEMVDADEISSPPGGNAWMTEVLTFPGSATGLPLDFSLVSSNYGFTWNDDEMSSGYYPMLSVGDADNGENDDFYIDVTGVTAPREVLAVGIRVGDNGAESDESLRVYGASDLLLAEFTAGLPDGSGYTFIGVVAAVPITRFFFNEGNGGDDICITEPCFGVTGGTGQR
ncbi:hypothetical protein HGA89_00080 [bacterium]|nr:hypothetical protein [bacterium]